MERLRKGQMMIDRPERSLDDIGPLLILINRPEAKQTRFRTWFGNKLIAWATRVFRSDRSFRAGACVKITIESSMTIDGLPGDPAEYATALPCSPKFRTTIVIEDNSSQFGFDLAEAIVKNTNTGKKTK